MVFCGGLHRSNYSLVNSVAQVIGRIGVSEIHGQPGGQAFLGYFSGGGWVVGNGGKCGEAGFST